MRHISLISLKKHTRVAFSRHQLTRGTTNMNDSSSFQTQIDGEDKGFTLIEILIAIVLVGILSAVAVVGISNLVSKGSTSACTATSDAAKAGSAVYFATNAKYPADFLALTVDATNGPALTLPTGVTNLAGTAIVAGNLAVTPNRRRCDDRGITVPDHRRHPWRQVRHNVDSDDDSRNSHYPTGFHLFVIPAGVNQHATRLQPPTNKRKQ